MRSIARITPVFLLCAALFTVCAVSLVTAPPVQAAAPQTTASSWNVSTYIWNSRLNLWARSSCDMPIGGIGVPSGSYIWCGQTQATKPSACTADFCDGRTDSTHTLKYYHEGGAGGIGQGEIRGKAWSPVFGTISFNQGDFPSTSCYGLTGAARQPRIVRVNLGSDDVINSGDSIYSPGDDISKTKVALVGCAYSSTLKDYILLSPQGATFPSSASPGSGWIGVVLDVKTGAASHNTPGTGTRYESGVTSNAPRIEISGCAWSEKNGNWSFGPNRSTIGRNANDCLPSQHNTKLKERIDTVAINTPGGSAVDISTVGVNRTARIGQRVTYSVTCPTGYSRALRLELFGGASAIDLIARDRQNPLSDSEWADPVNERREVSTLTPGIYDRGSRKYTYSEVLLSPLSALRLVCVDRNNHEIFSGKGFGETGVLGRRTHTTRGVSVESVAVHSFSVSPQVITEGGVVDIDVSVSNFDDAAKNNAFCRVTNTVTKLPVLCFKTESLSTTSTVNDLPNRSSPMYSTDTVVQDTSYELTCHFKKGMTTEYSESQLCADGSPVDSTWSKIGPMRATVKVSPSRLVNRIISGSTPAPVLDESNDKNSFVIGIPSAYINRADVRIYEFGPNEFSGGGNREVDPSRPDRIYAFFSNRAEADKATNSRCAHHQGRTGHLTCITNNLYGSYNTATVRVSMDGSTSVTVPKTTFAGKKLVAEVFTKDGRRSVKTVSPLVPSADGHTRSPSPAPPGPSSSGEVWGACRCTADPTDSSTKGTQTSNRGGSRPCVMVGCPVYTCSCTTDTTDSATAGVRSDRRGPCVARNCPVDGGWSVLPAAGDVPYNEVRTATCTNPPPQNSGTCQGTAPTVTGTRGRPCTAWTSWTPGIGRTCKGVSITQTRTCTAPTDRAGDIETRPMSGTTTCYGGCGPRGSHTCTPYDCGNPDRRTCPPSTYIEEPGNTALWWCSGPHSSNIDDALCPRN